MLSCQCCCLLGTKQGTDGCEKRSYTHDLDAGRDLDVSSVPLNNHRSGWQVHSSSLPEKERSKFSLVWIPDVWRVCHGSASGCRDGASDEGSQIWGALGAPATRSSMWVCAGSPTHQRVCTD